MSQINFSPDTSAIIEFHSHIYYDASTIETARAICLKATEMFSLAMGRMHERPVGPHPDWSCQLAYAPDLFGRVVPWLALNRHGLVVFTHPETGDELIDHRDHAIWMGGIRPLNLSMFERS